MLEIHTTRQGKEIPIVSMSDFHLTNFLKIAFEHHSRIKAGAMIADAISTKPKIGFWGRIKVRTGIAKPSYSRMVNSTDEGLKFLYPYLVEAYIRGLQKPREYLIDFVKRESAVDCASSVELSGMLDDILG